MRNYLAVGIAMCAACAQAVDEPASVEQSKAVIRAALTTDADGDQAVTLQLENARVLEFVASPNAAWVFERRPIDTASLLGAGTSAVSLYREIRDANPSLPELFAGFRATAMAPSVDPLVGVTANALTREEFLAGDGICQHYCATTEFQEHSTFPFESAEKCRTDIVGRDFRAPSPDQLAAVDTLVVGEKFFFAANARDVGGTLQIHGLMQEWVFDNGVQVDYHQSGISTKTKVIERGQAVSASTTLRQTGDPNVYRRGTRWAHLIGSDDSTYDYYTCAALSRTTPSSLPGQ